MMVASENEDLLHCSICTERFNNDLRKPKLLLCHHTFCQRCLIQCLVRTAGGGSGGGRSVTCPTCRKVTSISKKGVAALQDNFYLEPHLRRVSKEEIFHSDDEDEPVPSTSKRITKIWCETCMKVADDDCMNRHDISNYEIGMTRLASRLQIATERADQALSEEATLLEDQLELLTRAQSYTVGLDEHINATTLALATARSHKDALSENDSTHNPVSLLAALRDAEKQFRESTTRLKPLASQMTLASALHLSTVNIQCGDSTATEPTRSFNFKVEELKDDEEEAIVYFLCQILLKTNKNIGSKKNESITTTRGRDTSWHQVDRGRRGKTHQQSDSSQLYNISVTAKSRDRSAKSETSHHNSASPEGRSEFLLFGGSKGTVKIKPDVGINKKKVRCYFDISINGKPEGRVTFMLRPDVAPKMCTNFLMLCLGSEGFGYKGSKLFKGHPNDHVVGGDFEHNDGTGGYSIYNGHGLFLADEAGLKDEEGAIRMRGMGTDDETGAGLVGSQFHIWVGVREFRPYRRTLVIGYVVQGLDLLQHVSKRNTIKNSLGVHVFSDSIVIQACGTL